MTVLIIKALLAYLLGSVSGSMVIGTLRHVDIRKSGSGNAGGTNAFRTQGLWFALGVVVIDVGKGFLAAWLLPQLQFALPGESFTREIQMLVCGFAAVVGHCYPVWYGFRGGKGAATAVGALIAIQPMVIPPMLLTWLLVLMLTGWVGLGTMLAALGVVPVLIWLQASPATVWFGVLLAAFIVLMHRSNIVNMLNGTEYRFQRIRIVNWFR
ncbi:MAG: glycerol-3-phosphate 1-O-acyltransferase PlsY [Xanthomonadales bacterium]|nr:glycerol-3-phosphate 1-O-acyltransferase PlsY [Gammaproteobacteria bacterium]MBT8054566.1 glycerol-3-phosphate 1-O-acyltransferase PlsY [Gammaproteobacteria bacterium]NND56856.1 glycerol-3-phosphate 1-O-acyltransferase PlsY [Xanthomonadales bacterium]NNK52723.1 glycerol-3-phosphate 1-O-acyltransferase PlsY [Xanthomonadales bacterium]